MWCNLLSQWRNSSNVFSLISWYDSRFIPWTHLQMKNQEWCKSCLQFRSVITKWMGGTPIQLQLQSPKSLMGLTISVSPALFSPSVLSLSLLCCHGSIAPNLLNLFLCSSIKGSITWTQSSSNSSSSVYRSSRSRVGDARWSIW